MKTYKLSQWYWAKFNIRYILTCKWITNKSIRKERWKTLYNYNNLCNKISFLISINEPEVQGTILDMFYSDTPLLYMINILNKNDTTKEEKM